jgi:selenide, water dikinase
MHLDEPPITTDLVLVGGGHSHLFVLKQLAMQPLPGVRITLVTRDLHTPYSGMLPGYVAGHYSYDETHIDLLPLARFAAARVVHAPVEGIDCEARLISVQGRPPIDYDLLSINIGSRPKIPNASAKESAGTQFAVKPVDRFIHCWQQLEQRLLEREDDLHLAIVGGGAGGVELALSLQHRVRQLSPAHAGLRLSLVTDGDRLLTGHNARVRRSLEQVLQRGEISVHYQHAVEAFAEGELRGNFAPPLPVDAVIWVTSASPADWLGSSGLALDVNGFIEVNDCLQSTSHTDVFAAGDVASVAGYPRPKSGVFAVRQGIPLARNLRLRLQGRALKPFHPQSQNLSLISTGDRYAIASRGGWALKGKWCWWLKDVIDRKFVRRFSELPEMLPVAPAAQTGSETGNGSESALAARDIAPMHCGGCGSKVGSQVLEQVLGRISARYGLEAVGGLQQADDAALVEVPAGKQLIQSIDQFRSFIDDPYLFGRIAANHALGDLFAMGVEAHSALVVANVVYASEEKQAQDLYQLMSGVVETLQQHQTLLIGGHSGQAAQMSCGLSVNGFAHREALMLKQGMQQGDLLILTKALGSGILFAADMRAKARGAWLDAALEQMLVSSQQAARCFVQFAASACTDITGFGLAGHLFEMARASECLVEIDPERVPVFEGAAELAELGITSSLQPQNIRIRHSIGDSAGYSSHAIYPLLFDPQTAGGLLASVAPETASDCLQQLHQQGYADAQIIGRVCAPDQPSIRIRLKRF